MLYAFFKADQWLSVPQKVVAKLHEPCMTVAVPPADKDARWIYSAARQGPAATIVGDTRSNTQGAQGGDLAVKNSRADQRQQQQQQPHGGVTEVTASSIVLSGNNSFASSRVASTIPSPAQQSQRYLHSSPRHNTPAESTSFGTAGNTQPSAVEIPPPIGQSTSTQHDNLGVSKRECDDASWADDGCPSPSKAKKSDSAIAIDSAKVGELELARARAGWGYTRSVASPWCKQVSSTQWAIDSDHIISSCFSVGGGWGDS